MRVGLIGAGHIGSILGRRWAAAGHEVLFSYSTDPAKLRVLAELAGPLGHHGSIRDAVGFGDVVVLSVPWPRVHPVLDEAGDLVGQIVLDTTNPYAAASGEVAALPPGATAASQITTQRPGARLVKVFNTLYFATLDGQAHRAGTLLAIPISGDDDTAKAVAADLVRDIGYEPVDIGGLDGVARQEPGGPLYNAELTAEEVRAALAGAGDGTRSA